MEFALKIDKHSPLTKKELEVTAENSTDLNLDPDPNYYSDSDGSSARTKPKVQKDQVDILSVPKNWIRKDKNVTTTCVSQMKIFY